MINTAWKTIYQKIHYVHWNEQQKTKILNNLLAASMNLKYNCWIHLSHQDILNIIQNMHNNELFDRYRWWNMSVSFQYVLEYISEKSKTKNWKIPKLHKFNKKKMTWEIQYKKWYALILMIDVNPEFYNILCKWNIDEFTDYQQCLWSWEKHLLNIIKIMETSNLLDTYFLENWLKDCLTEVQLKTILEESSLNYFYCFL